MNDLSYEQLQQRVKDLEKQNRLLQKKLERSESNRQQLEDSHEIQSKLLNRIIQGLEQSRAEAEARSHELQEAFNNLQMMQATLIEYEKMSALGVLVAGIAHEINNPVNFIHGNIYYACAYVQNLVDMLSLYQKTYPEPDEQIQAKLEELEIEFVVNDLLRLLISIRNGSDRISDIVLGLRTFSRLDEAEYKKANLHDGLDSTLMLLQHRLKAHGDFPGITVIKHYGKLPSIPCFAGQLNQVFMNILVNAIDAIEERYIRQISDKNQYNPGWIKIDTSIVDTKWVRIAIADNGLGMSEQTRQKIFNPFFTTKPVGKGTGLGMAISYQIIIEKHGGKLDCFTQVAQGTEFVIHIPLSR
ncbi:sensor histidine kinase [Nostoc sp. CMAA1605]|uniref:sensor histidine kinase n=1 Tax=Nostoc sp. CMAA1605 TaxID=2055159 RepID=UPI001F16C1C9|nr:ATP-binding protein [Nostoc sp. CMAA1605]MCF4969923.1 sensor histidine kinase [Nostoc sp. CMAA1605]